MLNFVGKPMKNISTILVQYKLESQFSNVIDCDSENSNLNVENK